MQETQIWTLGQKDQLEEDMSTDSSIFAWRMPQTEEPGGLQSMELQRVGQLVLNQFSLGYSAFGHYVTKS